MIRSARECHLKSYMAECPPSINSSKQLQRNHFLSLAIVTPSQTSPGFYESAVQIFRKTLWEKKKLLVTSVIYPLGELSTIFIKFEFVVCKSFQFGKFFKFVVWEMVKPFPAVHDHRFIFRGECRPRSASTFVQFDLALRSPPLYNILFVNETLAYASYPLTNDMF